MKITRIRSLTGREKKIRKARLVKTLATTILLGIAVFTGIKYITNVK